jgi:hypothetical protein
MNSELHRYWYQLDLTGYDEPPAGSQLGVGVTAHDQSDATRLIATRVFGGRSLPPILSITSDVDISSLDPGHVRPNMGNVLARGIWFPLGYD